MAEVETERDHYIERQPLNALAHVFAGLPLYRLKSEPGSLVPVVNISDLDHVGDRERSLSQVTISDPGSFSRYRLKTGDVLVTARGTSLKLAVVPNHWSGALVASNLIGIRLDDRLRPELLFVFLNSIPGRQAIERRRAATNLLTLTPRNLGEIEVPVPPLAQQEALAELFNVAQELYWESLSIAEDRFRLAHRVVVSSLRGTSSSLSDGGSSEGS